MTIPTLRDRFIETTCSNMIMARKLPPRQVSHYMALITKMPDEELARQTLGSAVQLADYYKDWVRGSRN